VTERVDDLVLDLLEWIGPAPRDYLEVMDAWRTSCPRLPVWEEANERGYVERRREGPVRAVVVTPDGLAWLRARRASAAW
jgi:D-3-phosphoglycerate dehydrogenase